MTASIGPNSELLEEVCERCVRAIRRLLLKPMSDARDDARASKVKARRPWVFVKIPTGNEMADGVSLTADKIGRLGNRPPLIIGKLDKIDLLSAIAVQRATKSAGAESVDIQIELAIAHPFRGRIRIDHTVQQPRRRRLFGEPTIKRRITRTCEEDLSDGVGNVRLQFGFCDALPLKVELIEETPGIGLFHKLKGGNGATRDMGHAQAGHGGDLRRVQKGGVPDDRRSPVVPEKNCASAAQLIN